MSFLEGVVDSRGAALQSATNIQSVTNNTSKAFDKSIDKSSELEGLIYKFNSDKEYGVFENFSDAVTTLPYSLFPRAVWIASLAHSLNSIGESKTSSGTSK